MLSDFKADFGFYAPKETRKPCSNPEFADNKLHRIAIMKQEHMGFEGDRAVGGVPGWVTKHVCTGCGREWLNMGFYPDKGLVQFGKVD